MNGVDKTAVQHDATRAVHADDYLNASTDVAPAIHVSTTFRYSNDVASLTPFSLADVSLPSAHARESHIYSRESAPNTSRLEALLSSLLSAHAITYTSGLAAFHALLVFLAPRAIAIGAGYHGVHGVIDLHRKLTGLKKLDLFDTDSWDAAGLGAGDVVHVETPLNPTGEAYDIGAFAALAHARGAILTVDATFGPPGLQDPFKHGADVVMHSGTKYIGGHSDMLCGVLAVQREEWWRGLWGERLFLGSVMGSLEGWLGVRSLRTLELRVRRQSKNADRLVAWLDGVLREKEGGNVDGSDAAVRRVVKKIQHASLQKSEMHWLKKQMPNGFGPVFAIWMQTPLLAKSLPSKLHLFQHATSLGGVESLIEWRRMSDNTVDERVMRVSVGIENWEDLRDDMLQGFLHLDQEQSRPLELRNGA